MTHWEITQESVKLPALTKPVLIEGLPGIGNVGKIAVDFLIEELGAKKIYSFFSYKFPHSVFVAEDNLVEMPKVELYYKKGKRDFLFLTGDIQPIDEEGCYSFCDKILTIAREFGCSEIVTTGGIGLQHVPDKPKVYCTGNTQKLLQYYVKKGKCAEKKIFGVVGPLVGVSGVLLGLGKKRGMPGVAVLAETFGHPMYFGVKGAKEVLRVLDNVLGLAIDLKKMSKDILAVERELLKKTSEWASEIQAHAQAGAKIKDKEQSYIG